MFSKISDHNILAYVLNRPSEIISPKILFEHYSNDSPLTNILRHLGMTTNNRVNKLKNSKLPKYKKRNPPLFFDMFSKFQNSIFYLLD